MILTPTPEQQQALLRLCMQVAHQQHEHHEQHLHRFNWPAIARPKQLAPGTPGAECPRQDWRYWFLCCGRGFGKTRTGAEFVRDQVASGRRRRIALVAPTLNDGRKLMIEGVSGLLQISLPHERPTWRADRRELHWPNGAIGVLYTTEEPERLRGDEHDLAWCEEMGSWRNAKATWTNLRLMMRLRSKGGPPQWVITTTPRPTPLIREVAADPATVMVNGSTFENTENLAGDFVAGVKQDFEGTRLGQQELLGLILDDTPGALWKLSQIESLRVRNAPDLQRVVVAVDPAVADASERKLAEQEERFTAETGIVVVGAGRCLCRDKDEIHTFTLADLSGYYAPETWAGLVGQTYRAHKADRVVAEINNGGALVEALIQTLSGGGPISYRGVHASRGKISRAEPVAHLYEQRRAHHVGVLRELEDQMCTYNPLLSKKSPDRMDANVWGHTDLVLGPKAPSFRPPPSGGAMPGRRM